MAITPRAVGAWAYAASGSVVVTLPTHATGDMLLVRVAYKSSAVATCAASTATGGWNKLGEFVGVTNSGNGTGSVNLAVFYKEAASASETNPTITFSQAVTQVGRVGVSYQKDASETWVTPYAGVSPGTSFSATTSVSQLGAAAGYGAAEVTVAGDLIDFWLAASDDTTITVPTVVQTGVTFATVVEYPATAGIDTSGADGAYDGGYRIATAGPSPSAEIPRVTATLSTSETGSVWATRLRIIAAGNQTATPTTAALVITKNIPTVTASDHQLVTPTTKTLTATAFAPTVSTPELATPSTVSLTTATFAPSVVTGGAYVTAVLADSPVGYWRMGEASGSVLDSIGSSHGTATGTTRDVTGALGAGQDDGAITFNGTSDKVRMGDVLDQTGAVTYELWLKRANTTAALQYVMSHGAWQPNIVIKADHYLNVGEENVDLVTSTTAILNNTDWHHIVFTWTGVNSAGASKLYVDGVDVGSEVGTATIAASSNASPLSLGAAYVDALWFAGSIDEAAIYNTVLSPTRVLAHYNAGVGPQVATPTTTALTLATFAPTITATEHQAVTPTTRTLTLATFAPTVTTPELVTPTTKALALAAFAPVVTATDVQLVTPATAAIALSAFAPTISLTDHQLVTPTTKTAVLTTFAPTVTAPDHQLVTPSNAAVTLATFAPTVTSAQHQTATPTTATLTTASFAPAISVSDHQAVIPTTKVLTLTTNAPTVTTPILATPTTAALVTTSNAPTVTTPQTVTPTTASLVTSAFAPTVTNPQTYVPDTAALTLTRFVPIVDVTAASTIVVPNATLTITRNNAEVSATAHLAVTPQAATLTITQFAPTVTATAHEVVTPPVKSLIAATFAPTVSTSDQQGIVPGKATLTLATFAPTVSTTAHVAVIPSTKVLQLQAFASTARVANYAIPTTAALTLSQFAPLVSATQNAYVEIVPNALTITEYAPVLSITGHADIVPLNAELHLALFPPTAEQHSITPLGEFVYGFAVVAMGDSGRVEGQNGGATVRSEGGGTTVSTSGPSARVTVR